MESNENNKPQLMSRLHKTPKGDTTVPEAKWFKDVEANSKSVEPTTNMDEKINDLSNHLKPQHTSHKNEDPLQEPSNPIPPRIRMVKGKPPKISLANLENFSGQYYYELCHTKVKDPKDIRKHIQKEQNVPYAKSESHITIK